MNKKTCDFKPKILFKKQVEQLLNLNIQTLRRMWNKGKFPKPNFINDRCCWKAEVIHQWIQENFKG